MMSMKKKKLKYRINAQATLKNMFFEFYISNVVACVN